MVYFGAGQHYTKYQSGFVKFFGLPLNRLVLIKLNIFIFMDSLEYIKAVIFDVDGTMTDGTIWLDKDNEYKRSFHVLDGEGINRLINAGYTTGVITAADSTDVEHRIKFLNIHYFYKKSRDKLKDFLDFLGKTKYKANEVCYIGDDLTDIPVLNKCGFSVCPKNAIDEVKEVSCYITKSPGGKGAVRELCDIVLKYGYHNL